MSSPSPNVTPATNPTTTQTPVASRNAAADTAARQKKNALLDEATTQKSILTSGAGVLDDTKLKKNTLLGG